MNEDERLRDLLRGALSPVTADHPARDLWPAVAERIERRSQWSRFDVGLAVIVTTAIGLFPQALWLIVYHL